MTELDMLEDLQGCESIDALHAATRRVARRLGFDHFLYAVRVSVSPTRPYQFIFSGYPAAWWEHYRDSGYDKADPIVAHSLQRTTPLPWSDRVFATPQSARIMNEARQFGLVTGVTCPVHGGRGEAALLSLVLSEDSPGAHAHIAASLGGAQLLACYLHEAVQRLVLSAGVLPIGNTHLTVREKECLQWSAEGKTSWEIAHILNMSERTVVFHIQNAARKLGVANRRHAVARAVSMGLIAP